MPSYIWLDTVRPPFFFLLLFYLVFLGLILRKLGIELGKKEQNNNIIFWSKNSEWMIEYVYTVATLNYRENLNLKWKRRYEVGDGLIDYPFIAVIYNFLLKK